MPYEIPALAGKPYQPSNGTEGMDFIGQWCDRCQGDAGFSERPEDGCPIIARAMLYRPTEDEYPKEWTHDERGRPMCTAFAQTKGESE